MPFCCFVAFLWKFTLLFLVKKVTISETSTEIFRTLFFLTMFEKMQIRRKIWICLTYFFDQTSKRGQILTKTVFLPKFSHIQLNHAFLFFCSILGEIQRELLFLVRKVTITETSTENSESLLFLPCLKRVKSWVKFGFVKTTFFDQTSKSG